MSLPHSFFTRITGGGEFAFIREYIDTSGYSYNVINNMNKPIKYHPANGNVYFMAQQTYGGLATATYNGVDTSDGSVTLYRQLYDTVGSTGVEPRAFDIWPDGNMLIASESGGTSYIHYFNSELSTKPTNSAMLYNGGSGNGYMYVRSVVAYNTPTYGNYFYVTGNFGGGPMWFDYAPFGATAISYNQKRNATANSNIPQAISAQALSSNLDNWYAFEAGRFYDVNWLTHTSVWNGFLSGAAIRNVTMDGGYSGADALYWDVEPHGGKLATDNTELIYYAAGYTSNGDIPIIEKSYGLSGGNWVLRKSLLRTADSSNGSASIRGLAWDSVNNKLYAVGKMYCPNSSDSRGYSSGAARDGFVACFSTPKNTTTTFTMDWILGIQETVNGLQHVDIDAVTVDGDGQAVIMGTRNNGTTSAGSMFVAKLPTDGAVTGNYGNFSFYDMSPYIQLGNWGGTGTGRGDTGGSWSTNNVTWAASRANPATRTTTLTDI